MKVFSEIIEINERSNDKVIGISKWYLNFIPQPIKLSQYGSKLSVHFIMFDGGSRFVLKHQLLHTFKYLQSIKTVLIIILFHIFQLYFMGIDSICRL